MLAVSVDDSTAELLAAQAERIRVLEAEVEGLLVAMQTRGVIDQAKGMLMAQTPSLSADDAFRLLVAASQRENVKLHDIACRIAGRGQLLAPDGYAWGGE